MGVPFLPSTPRIFSSCSRSKQELGLFPHQWRSGALLKVSAQEAVNGKLGFVNWVAIFVCPLKFAPKPCDDGPIDLALRPPKWPNCKLHGRYLRESAVARWSFEKWLGGCLTAGTIRCCRNQEKLRAFFPSFLCVKSGWPKRASEPPPPPRA